MTQKLYDGANCPCPADCSRHGKCAECMRFHHGKKEPTYCEFLAGKIDGDKPLEQPERAQRTGREIRLLDYAPCAG